MAYEGIFEINSYITAKYIRKNNFHGIFNILQDQLIKQHQ